jgi:hypothetical protein
MKIIDHKIYHDGQKMGWIDGEHVRDGSNAKLGYFQNGCIYNETGQKIAYIHENDLMFENGQSAIPLEHINGQIEGTDPLLVKCAVHVLMEG